MRQQIRSDVEMLSRVLDRLVCQGILEEGGEGEHKRYHLKGRPASRRMRASEAIPITVKCGFRR